MSTRSRWVIASDARVNLRRAAFLLAILLLLPAASAFRADAAESRVLEVQRVKLPTPAGGPAARERAAAPGAPLGARERAAIAARAERQKAFREHEAELHRAAYRVGPTLASSRRRGWTAPAKSAAASPRFATDGVLAVPTDTVRVAFLRVDFLTDRGGSASTGTGQFNLAPEDTIANPVDRPPHNRTFYRKHGEALASYYDVQSYGRVRIEVDVWPAEEDSSYHLSDMADLGPWAFGNSIFRAAVDMMRLCFFAADSQSIVKNDRIPWAKYDRFMIIHAGSDLQSDTDRNSKEDIPSFTMFVDDTDRVIFADSSNRDRPIDRVAFIPETINQDGLFGALNGVIAHENGHNFFGLGDVYDISFGLPVAGWWSLMDSGNLLPAYVQTFTMGTIFAVGLLPPSIDPFQRNFILDEGLVNYRIPGPADTAAFVLRGSARTNDFVKLDLSSDEYLILENRNIADASLVRLQRDDTTGVVLGPRDPDRYEWDALLPGAGVLVWHVDESVIPFLTSLRTNPDFGFNSNFRRRGLQIIEADGLDDLGDLGSPDWQGGRYDPYQNFFAPLLSETTIPNLIPNQGTRPHMQVEFLDNARDDFRVRVTKNWQLPGWPVRANFPPGGPTPLAADLDGDNAPEIVWAGGDSVVTDPALAAAVRDSAAIFAVRGDGKGIGGVDTLDFAHLDRRPRPEVAALAANGGPGGIVFATTYHDFANDPQGGKLWAVTTTGASLSGFPVTLPSPASTPPVVLGNIVDGWLVLVGCEDGRVRAVDPTGAVTATSSIALGGGVRGRLAAWLGSAIAVPPTATGYVAAAGANGEVAVFSHPGLAPVTGWPVSIGANGPSDFLWLRMGGSGANASNECGGNEPTLVGRNADRLYAWCVSSASLLPGWGVSFGDTLVAGLGAGDADGDGFPEVLVQGVHSQLAYINRTGRPSPGWPRSATTEGFRTQTPPLAVDLTSDGQPEIVALNASGVIGAFDGAGRVPNGWPLATGVGASGSMVAADINGDGALEIVAPDRFGLLYAYAVPVSPTATGSPWRMLGGDPGRSSSLPDNATSSPGTPSAGPLVSGSLKAYPNPARMKPVQFAYQLTEDASVEFRVLDASGHEVARWSRSGRRSDNLDVWDPSGVPAGLYVARVKFSGPGGSHTESLPLGILR